LATKDFFDRGTVTGSGETLRRMKLTNLQADDDDEK
jgi:hypothetical protein